LLPNFGAKKLVMNLNHNRITVESSICNITTVSPYKGGAFHWNSKYTKNNPHQINLQQTEGGV
jgi:hypothetical protein